MKRKALKLVNYRNILIASFCLLAVAIGLFNIKSISPLSIPDPTRGYFSSVAIANGQIGTFFYNKTTDNTYPVVSIPQEYERLKDCSQNQVVSSAIADFDRSCDHNFVFDPNNKSQVDVSIDMQMPALSFIPQSIGIKVGMIFNQSPLRSLAFARLANLMIYILCFALAIYFIPRGKIFVAAIGLLPSMIFLGSSINPDALNIAVCALFIAYTYKLALQRTKLSHGQLAIVILLGGSLFFLKVAYIPLLILILAINKNALRTRSKIILFLAMGILGSLAYFAWYHYAGHPYINPDVAPFYDAQKAWIMSHPVHSLLAVVYGVGVEISKFLTLDLGAFVWMVTALFVAIIIYACKISYDKVRTLKEFFRKYHLVVLAIVAGLASIALALAALLLTWTPYQGYQHIIGFQDRYLFELLLLLLAPLQLGAMKALKE